MHKPELIDEESQWVEHDGGKCPVHPAAIVEVRFSRGANPPVISADMWDWSAVKRYRIVKDVAV